MNNLQIFAYAFWMVVTMATAPQSIVVSLMSAILAVLHAYLE